MPPQIKIDKDSILDACVNIVREKGWESINARDIAKSLGCSTQPVFRAFHNMSELKKAVWARSWGEYNKYIERSKKSESTHGIDMGKMYIKFAQEERNLFKLLFMSDALNYKNLHSLIHEIDNSHNIIEIFMKISGLNREKAYILHFRVWMFMHGLASLAATNQCVLTDDDIEKMIKECFKANQMELGAQD